MGENASSRRQYVGIAIGNVSAHFQCPVLPFQHRVVRLFLLQSSKDSEILLFEIIAPVCSCSVKCCFRQTGCCLGSIFGCISVGLLNVIAVPT